jgi:hypothetical protein
LKSASKLRISSFVHPSKIFVWGAYNWENREKAGLSKMGMSCRQLHQTKILEDRTKDRRCVFDLFYNDSSPKLSTHINVKHLKIARSFFCSVFQNLRLGGIELRDFTTHLYRVITISVATKIAQFLSPL